MSLLKEKLVDTRVDGGAAVSTTHYGIVGTGSNVRQSYSASSVSQLSMDFTITTPSQSTYIGRRVDISMKIPFSFRVLNNTTSAVTLALGTHLAIEAFPMNSIINQATVQINTSNFTTQQQQILPLLKRKLRSKASRDLVAPTPASLNTTHIIYPQGITPYAQGAAAGTLNDEDSTLGNASNSAYIEFTGAGATVTASSGAGGLPAGQLITGFLVIKNEPLLLEPFDISDDLPGLVNVNVLNVRLNFSALDDRFARPIRFIQAPLVSRGGDLVPSFAYGDLRMGYPATATPQAAARLIPEAAALTLTYLNPPFTAALPSRSIYPYVHYNPLTVPIAGPIAPRAAFTVDSNLITLNVCPDALALYIIPDLPVDLEASNDGRTKIGTALSFVPVGTGYMFEDQMIFPDAVELTFNNNASLLNTLDATEFARITRRNGIPGPGINMALSAGLTLAQNAATAYVVPQAQLHTTGGPVVIKFNQDLPLEPGVSAGTAGIYTFQVRLKGRNPYDYTMPGATLFVVPIYTYYLTIFAGATSSILTAVLDEETFAGMPVSGDTATTTQLAGETATKDLYAVEQTSRTLGALEAMQAKASMSGGSYGSGPIVSAAGNKRSRDCDSYMR